jgi:PAS domain S-box-containing protein
MDRVPTESLDVPADLVVRQVRDYAIVLIDLEGRFRSWNEGVRHILGWDETSWLGQPAAVAFTDEDAQAGVPQQELAAAASNGRADDDRWMKRRDGTRFFCTGSVTAIRGDDGRPVAYLKVMRDSTEAHDKAEECERALAAERDSHSQAERQAALLRATIDAIPDAVYIGTAEGITECNQQGLELLGARSLEDLQHNIGELGRAFRVRHERDGQPVAPEDLPFSRALRGEAAMLETWATKPSGEDVLIRGTAAPIRVGGEIVGAVAVNSDLTQRVQLEEKRIELAQVEGLLRERDEEFRAIVHAVRDYAIFTVDVDGLISSWHVGAQLMKGYSAEEAIGMPFANLFTPEDRAIGQPEHEMELAARTGEYKGEGRRRRKGGEAFEAAVVLTGLRGQDGRLLGYLKLTQDISERKRAEAEREALLRSAEAARAEADRANSSKSEFLATISHELRTPLGAIIGWAHLLERGMPDPEGTRHGLAAIARNARVQGRLIEDLLDMSRIESGQLKLELQRVDLASVVSGAVDAVLPSANAKEIAMQTQLDPRAGPVMADPARLQQVIVNLLGNAVKFTPAGGRVVVSARRAGASVDIAVSDTGQGMTPEFVGHAFDRFQQQDPSSTRRHGGLGIGLAIVREITHLHGGSVRAESAGPGRGPTFTVSLPALDAKPSRREAHAEDAPADDRQPADDARLSGFTLLLIDDEPDGLEVTAYALRSAGAEVMTAAGAEEGFQLFRERRPHAILCDIGMPGQDGHEFIRRVRELESATGRHTPAAAFTAFARTEDSARSTDAGFDVHLVKPMSPAELVQATADVLRRGLGDTVER